MTESSSNAAFATRLFEAIIAGDTATIESLVAPGATMWQNTDHTDIPRDRLIAGWTGVAAALPGARLDDVRRASTPTGFVEQHTLRARGPSGEDVGVYGCFIGTVEQGLLTRIEEYVDSAQVASLITLLGLSQ